MKLRAVVRYSDGLRCGFEFLVVTDEQKLMLRQVLRVIGQRSPSLCSSPLKPPLPRNYPPGIRRAPSEYHNTRWERTVW